MIYNSNIRMRLSVMIILLIMVSSCRKFLTLDPPKSKIESDVVFSSEVTAKNALLGIYAGFTNNSTWFSSGGEYSIMNLAGLSADELFYVGQYDLFIREFEENHLRADNKRVEGMWQSLYSSIYRCNAIIEGVNGSASIPQAAKPQLVGEALGLRAFCYFYLVNLFGDVPLAVSTDYKVNSVLPRVQIVEVYKQIITDLQQARELLAPEYAATNKEKIRINKHAATALLARVYLYTHDWANAEAMATEVIGHTEMYDLNDDLNQVFLKNSKEAIWQLMPAGYSSFGSVKEAELFEPNNLPNASACNARFADLFESGDLRWANWVDTFSVEVDTIYYPYKYKQPFSNEPLVEYSMVIRLAELFLIRAESRAMQQKLTGANSAASDINEIRNRADLPNTTAITQPALLDAILKERRTELFLEWGHRWLDLKRTKRATEVLSGIKLGWDDNDTLYPIPTVEMSKNVYLKPQNNGY